MRKIVLSHGGTSLRELELKPGTITIGRGDDNDLTLDDAYASTHHAKLTTFFDSTYVEDMGSTNGTYLNGKKVQMHTVHAGDVITVGRHQLVLEGAPHQPAKPAEAPAQPQHTTVISRDELDQALAARQAGAGRDAPTKSAGTGQGRGPRLQVVAGANAGANIPVDSDTLALGGGVVLHRGDGRCSVARSAGGPDAAHRVLINGRRVTEDGAPIKDMDVLQIDDTWLAFYEG